MSALKTNAPSRLSKRNVFDASVPGGRGANPYQEAEPCATSGTGEQAEFWKLLPCGKMVDVQRRMLGSGFAGTSAARLSKEEGQSL